MGVFNAMNISASGLTAQRMRMDIAASNIANAQSTRARINASGEYEPYRRKMVTFETKGPNFHKLLRNEMLNQSRNAEGVKVSRVIEDQTPFQLDYNPMHPDADENGYLRLPNVDPLKEMVDIMSATRSYEANVTSLNATKNMLLKALEIGK